MQESAAIRVTEKRLGVIVGGSGLLGGALVHHFKSLEASGIDVLAPNSKRLSLREPEDIKQYLQRYRPDFIINTAISAIDSDPQLAFETNYLGTVHLAKRARDLKIPYIHISSAAVLPPGENLTEEEHLPLNGSLSSYTKSKLMAEMTLNHLHREQGLDHTIIRLGVVYGKHDHKIKGFQRLLFSVADQSMPVMLTEPHVLHSYTQTKKLPAFIEYILTRREEFSGQTYHFVDRNPVLLAELILTIRNYLELKTPWEIYVPFPLANLGKKIILRLLKSLGRVGVQARMPAELMFLENFYTTQTLSGAKLEATSYGNPDADTTVFTELPDMIRYYLTRWEHLNLISSFNRDLFDPGKRTDEFIHSPGKLLETMHRNDLGADKPVSSVGPGGP